jgi:nucleoside-diphosphate-sugar epimerase
MKILITGAKGYIGKALTTELSGHDLTLLHRGVCEITDEKQVDDFFLDMPYHSIKYDVVIHCAVAGGSRRKNDSSEVLHDNLKMFLNLYKHKHKFDKLIHFGSGAQYHAPDTYYGLSKSLISEIVETENKFFNIIIYGLFDKNELETRFIKSCINNCKEDKPITVHKNKQMDFFHMEDLLKLINEYIDGTREDKQVECVYMEMHDLCQIARMVISEMGKGEIILEEPGLDKPYVRVGGVPNWVAGSGNLKDRIIQTVGELK